MIDVYFDWPPSLRSVAVEFEKGVWVVRIVDSFFLGALAREVNIS